MTTDRWSDAILAGTLASVDPVGLGGVRLRARHGPVRERWLADCLGFFPDKAPNRRIPPSIDMGRLLGGLDFAATLSAGRTVMETGVLAGADGGVLVIAMAERLPRATAAMIADALDRGCVRIEREGFSGDLSARFAAIALDEGVDNEAVPSALGERLAFTVDLDGIAMRDAHDAVIDRNAVAEARQRLPLVTMSDDIIVALTGMAVGAGRRSARVPLFLFRAARASASLRGSGVVELEDAAVAARLVIGALALAELADRNPPPPPQPPEQADTAESPDDHEARDLSMVELIVEAAAASLPDGLLEMARGKAAAAGNAAERGRSGIEAKAGTRGRSVGIVSRPPHAGARIDLLATLRAASPWQKLRAGKSAATSQGRSIRITGDDFRYARRREQVGTTAIFAVDASGSAAMARLAETKGAIELLLAECYIRRDQVALVAFRGGGAETILEPTRSLVRAKRSLCALPGGGATPLAHGIVSATALAVGLKRRGMEALTVFLTDGRGNVCLDGGHGREAAMADVASVARRFRALGLRGVVIDTGMRPQPAVDRLACDLGAEYVALPRGGPERISAELAARMRD
jgi:magnesium chelatase subunit D